MGNDTTTSIPKPGFREAFGFWLKLGFISFGGPAGQIAIMHHFLVEKKKWISDSRFLHGLNYCMVLPGPEAQQLATYIGWLLHGVRGGLVAGLLFILPSVCILLALSVVYVLFGKIEWVASLFYGLKPAVVAIVILALVKIGKKSLLTSFHKVVAALSFMAIFVFNVPFPWIIVTSIALGWVALKYFSDTLALNQRSLSVAESEHGYYLNAWSPPITHGLSAKSVALKATCGIVLGFLPQAAFLFFRADNDFWTMLSAFFTKAAFVTFGGAYAVLPYVAQQSVENYQWLSEHQMIDGLALGETTPGPLIMVLAFVGFMAGFNHGGSSVVDGTLGLLTTTFYTFLPSFLFIFLGAPFIERTKENQNLKAILSIISAAVVGVVLNLTIYLGKAVLFPSAWQQPDWFSLAWLAISFVALYRFTLNMIFWIGVSAVYGFALYLIR